MEIFACLDRGEHFDYVWISSYDARIVWRLQSCCGYAWASRFRMGCNGVLGCFVSVLGLEGELESLIGRIGLGVVVQLVESEGTALWVRRMWAIRSHLEESSINVVSAGSAIKSAPIEVFDGGT